VPLDFMMVRQALNKGVNLPAEAVADPAVPLKSVLAAAEAALPVPALDTTGK
jgi:3-phenylpropionate/trans-cinnamate dioxygenase ferredoxin reductase subunit